MKEFVLVEFVAHGLPDEQLLISKLELLGTDFEIIKEQSEWDVEDLSSDTWVRISGKINSEVASLIKLQDKFLAERMRISYIPEDLKDKYRR